MDSPWPNNTETGIFLENQTLALSLTGLQPYIPEQTAMSTQHYSSPTSILIFADHLDAAAQPPALHQRHSPRIPQRALWFHHFSSSNNASLGPSPPATRLPLPSDYRHRYPSRPSSSSTTKIDEKTRRHENFEGDQSTHSVASTELLTG
jgi:hypothetical protein